MAIHGVLTPEELAAQNAAAATPQPTGATTNLAPGSAPPPVDNRTSTQPRGIVNTAIAPPAQGAMIRPPNQPPIKGQEGGLPEATPLAPQPAPTGPQTPMVRDQQLAPQPQVAQSQPLPTPTPAPAPTGPAPLAVSGTSPNGPIASGTIEGEKAITHWMQGGQMDPGLQRAVINSAFNLGALSGPEINNYLAGGATGYLPSDPQKFGWQWDPNGKTWVAPGGGNSAGGITWNAQTQRFQLDNGWGGVSATAPAYGTPGAQNLPQAGGIVNTGTAGGQPGQPGAPGAPGAPGTINPATGQPYTAGGSNVVNGTDLSQFAPATKEYNPVMGQVDANQTVQGQLGDILKRGNPLLEAARARAMQQANARGLQNTSMAAQAGEEAMVSAAMPIAQADAAAYQKQALVNQDITNQFLSMKEGAQLDLQKAYEAFKQNNFMFDKDEKLKRYLNDSQISSQEKVAAMQTAAQISAAQIHANAAIQSATLQANTELKALGMKIDAEKVIEQARLTSSEKLNLANLSQNAFNNYVSGMNQILGTQMEPGDKDKWIRDYNTFWAGNGYLKDSGITIKLPGG